MRWIPPLFFAAFLISLAPSSAVGVAAGPEGVRSNLLVDGERVIFTQAGGSLTVLDLETGEVLQRKKDGYSELKRVKAGILAIRFGTISLLDPQKLSVIWEFEAFREVETLEQTLVSTNGWGLVEHRRLADGSLLWSYNLPGAREVVVEARKVLVHRAATHNEAMVSMTVLLDLESGEEVFRKIPPPGTHWPDAYFDGENIYLKEGFYTDARKTNRLENVVVWNTQGEEIRKIPLDEKMRKDLRRGSAFKLEDKRFSRDGRIHTEQAWWEMDLPAGTYITHVFQEGRVLVCRHRGQLELWSPDGGWAGTLPYLPDNGHLRAASRSEEKLLIGSDFGHVECIDIATGESLWLYIFPASLGSRTSRMTSLADFRRQKKNLPVFGFTRLNEEPSPTRVIFDPQPNKFFPLLPLYVGLAWGVAVLSFAMVVFLHVHPRFRKAVTGEDILVILVPTVACFFYLGKASDGSSIALRLAILAGLIAGIFRAAESFQGGNTRKGVFWLCLFIGAGAVLLPFVLRG